MEEVYFYFLIEDKSGTTLIKRVMDKLQHLHPEIKFICDYKSFHGCGSIPKKSDLKSQNVKTDALLNTISKNIEGYQRLKDVPRATLVVVVDSDKRDVEKFRSELENIGDRAPGVDKIYGIAVQESEAWLLGDKDALLAVYPRAKVSLLRHTYDERQDGTWEFLTRVVDPKKLAEFQGKKRNSWKIGEQKIQWAERIGANMDLSRNKSPSFNRFLSEIEKRLQ